METLTPILIGFISGLFARVFSSGRNKMGFILTIILGVGGSFVSTTIGRYLGIYDKNQIAGIIGSIVGSIAILSLIKYLKNLQTH